MAGEIGERGAAMNNTKPYVITISRQLGSGGAYIGQKLASRLNILYVDRELINEAADKLGVMVEDLEVRDERTTTIWQSFINNMSYGNFVEYTPPAVLIPNSREIYQAEAEVISRIAEERPAVIIGRGGFHTLRQHPRCLNIFLHADLTFRTGRVMELYSLSEQKAKKLIEDTDRARAHYIHTVAGCNMAEACNYHMSLDTGVLGMETVEDIIVSALKARFQDIELP